MHFKNCDKYSCTSAFQNDIMDLYMIVTFCVFSKMLIDHILILILMYHRSCPISCNQFFLLHEANTYQ